MKEAINVGYYRLNVETDGDQQQVNRIVRDFNVGFGAAVRSVTSDKSFQPAPDVDIPLDE
jgi:hypothetical protein